MSQVNPDSARRTRAFARVIGPFVALATLIVAIRLPDLTGLIDDLFANAVLPWILGAMMLVVGLIVIAFISTGVESPPCSSRCSGGSSPCAV
jgi:hypothetical protein